MVKITQWVIPVIGMACLLYRMPAAAALLSGIAVALILGNPHTKKIKKATSRLLSLSVTGLGAGMNLLVVAKVGLHGLAYTALSITAAFVLGSWFGRLLDTSRDTSILLTVGSAICGGSAIAAVAPVLRAKDHEVSISLAIVFLLNASALLIFPAIGHAFSLSESQFGLWSALAIHDTSSVVGATLQYGPRALEVGTTVKLARALWIVPVTFMIGLLVARRPGQPAGAVKSKKPWFILGFLLMAALVTWIPELRPTGHIIESVAKRLLVLTLFLIGSSLTRETLGRVGFKPFFQGVALWLAMGGGTLLAILEGWIA